MTTAGDRTLFKTGACSEPVLHSFLCYVMFLYTFIRQLDLNFTFVAGAGDFHTRNVS